MNFWESKCLMKERNAQIFQGLGLTMVCDTGEGSSLDKNNSPALGECEQARHELSLYFSAAEMGHVRITSWYPNFNGSHFGLPPSSIHKWLDSWWQICVSYDVFAQAPFWFLKPARAAKVTLRGWVAQHQRQSFLLSAPKFSILRAYWKMYMTSQAFCEGYVIVQSKHLHAFLKNEEVLLNRAVN